MLRYFEPHALKDTIKGLLLKRLSAEPEIVSRIATRVIRQGFPAYLNWDFHEEKRRVLSYLAKRQVGEFDYTFSPSSTKPTVYSSIYACMLLGLFGELRSWPSNRKRQWCDYFDRFQVDHDGLFRDPVLACDAFEGTGSWGDGWGVRHLSAHMIIAYARLGAIPKYSLRFLDPFYHRPYLTAWLDQFAFDSNVWSASNYIMNLYSLMQFARDYMGEQRAHSAVTCIADWLLARQSPETGMWHRYSLDNYSLLADAIRGAYHFFPLFTYDRKTVPHRERIVDHILRSQNSWGAFESECRPSGACEDIDALEPLVRFTHQTGYRKQDTDIAAKRALVWILANRNSDGGYESLMENGCHYGIHPETNSLPGESNFFATWFRTLCIAYLTTYLGLDNGYDIARIPGYEIQLGPEPFPVATLSS